MKTDILMDREEKKIYELECIQELVEAGKGLVKTKAITDLGIDYRRILQFVEEGSLTRVKSGYYTTKSGDYSEEQLIVAMYPDGILTLGSALYYHGYLKQRPFGWSIAISKNTSKSRFKIEYPIVTPCYTEPEVMELGVTTVDVAGSEMKIYDKDRLICDVLKYQEKLDRDDFREGVFAYIRDESKQVDKLMEYARERQVLKKVQSMIGVWL